MTSSEAYHALNEMETELEPEHIADVLKMLDYARWHEWITNMPQTD